MTDGYALALVGVAIAGLVAGVGGAFLVVRSSRRGHAPVDVPDDRRTHSNTTARGGGVGIIVAGAIALPFAQWWSSDAHSAYLLAVLVLAWATPNALIGLTDDYFPLPAALKLAMQLAASVLAVALGLRLSSLHLAPFPAIDLGLASWPFSVLWLVWLANLFNFMDGSDGLAATCGTLFFAALAVLGLINGAPGIGLLGIGVAAGCMGFFALNRPVASVFMGDGGSLYAGALLGGLPLLLGNPDGAGVSLAAPLIILAPFWFDATYTLIRRAIAREQLLEPHTSHLYQRLAVTGWSSWKLIGLYGGWAASVGVAGVLFPDLDTIDQAVALLTSGIAMVGVVTLTHRAEATRS